MRILVIADEYPWPPRTGYKQRLREIVRILAGLGTVDLLAVVSDAGVADRPAPADVPLTRTVVTTAGTRPSARYRRTLRWLSGAAPRDLLRRDWTAARTVLSTWSSPPYDLVWFSHARTFLALHDVTHPPRVVDLDNLQAAVLRHRGAAKLRSLPAGLRPRVRQLAGAAADRLDERRWRRLEDDIAAAADAVVVCSEIDRIRLGHPNAWVVANGYDIAGEEPVVATRAPAEGAGVLIMVGLMTYGPNRDAADYFAREVLPRVRLRRPNAQFRLVGRHGGPSDMAALVCRSGVVLTGEVDDVSRELATSDVAVVPVRFGGGTRIKILEAFAHRVPVVTTTVGCEGLDVVDGQHLLVADDPEAFALACCRLFDDAELRTRLVAAAADLWERRYRWEGIGPAIVEVVRAASAG